MDWLNDTTPYIPSAVPRPSNLNVSLTWTRLFIVLVATFGASLLFAYALAVYQYRSSRKSNESGQVPPTYPTLIPFIGSAFSLLQNTQKFVRSATSYNGKLTTAGISLPGIKIYLIQDRQTIRNFMKHRNLSSAVPLYVFALKRLWGMPKKGIDLYLADDSGPNSKPLPGSNAGFRLDYQFHKTFAREWTGPALIHTTQRFRKALQSRIGVLDVSSQSWTEVDDFFNFFYKSLSASVIESVFGSYLLELNPGLIDDLSAYDDALPWMGRGIPSLIWSAPYRIRNRLRSQISKWQTFARANFRESDVDQHGADPYWGTAVIRSLVNLLSEAGNLDDDALSAHNLGMIFGINVNAITSALMMSLQIIKDPVLFRRVREELDANLPQGSSSWFDEDTNLKDALELPLLSSVYAETLRLHVKVFFFASSSHSDAVLGKWRLPKGGLGVINSDGPHTDEDIWNSQNGAHPVNTFWADRFLVDPLDPSSGPLNLELRKAEGYLEKEERQSQSSKYFSTQGLEGAWIPYGGGPAICPGRFLAKNISMLICAVLVREFDFETKGDFDLTEFDTKRYGLGVMRAKKPVSMRIKRRDKGITNLYSPEVMW